MRFLSLPPTCPLFYNPFIFWLSKNKEFSTVDLRTSACFLEEEFTKRIKIPLRQKPKPIHIEVIDGQSLLFGTIVYEPEPIEVTSKDHNRYIIFNIIRTPLNPIVLGLSWLKKHNPSIDRKSQMMTFP